MVLIPGGTFERGSGASPDEMPVTAVELSPFSMDKFPVTNADFAVFIQDGGYERQYLWTPEGWAWTQRDQIKRPNYWDDPLWSDPDVPVTGIGWWEALAFARWAGGTLPTEAQWEYACRGRSGNTYPWGEQEPDLTLANYAPESDPVDRRPTRPDEYARNVSEFGCRDLVGNFAEWCLDNYSPRHQATGKDPVHLTVESDSHVVRGGCGLHDEDFLRCSARDHYHPGLRDNLIGFRCVGPADQGEV